MDIAAKLFVCRYCKIPFNDIQIRTLHQSLFHNNNPIGTIDQYFSMFSTEIYNSRQARNNTYNTKHLADLKSRILEAYHRFGLEVELTVDRPSKAKDNTIRIIRSLPQSTEEQSPNLPLDWDSLVACGPNMDKPDKYLDTVTTQGIEPLEPTPMELNLLKSMDMIEPETLDLVITQPNVDPDDLACAPGQAVDPNQIMGCNNHPVAEPNLHPNHSELTPLQMDHIQKLVITSLKLFNANSELADSEVQKATQHFDNLCRTS
jgi:hypothetical protein